MKLAFVMVVCVSAWVGCGSPTRFAAPGLRYPASLNTTVYGPRLEVLGEEDLEVVGGFLHSQSLCERSANPPHVWDLSDDLNRSVESQDGEAVTELTFTLLPPPRGEDAATGTAGYGVCPTVEVSGQVVRRRDARISSDELREACDAGRGRECAVLGDRALQATTGQGEVVRAVADLARGCELGSALACERYGFLFARGVIVERNDDEALRLEHRACEGGRGPACAWEADLYARIEGPRHDATLAADRHEHACRLGVPDSCHRLGLLCAAGVGVRRDLARAVILQRRACAGDVSPACAAAGALLEARGARSEALFYDRLACARGESTACAAATRLLAATAP